jgi:uncharacterized membrane protein YbhN (UPF0104 family)
LNVSSACILFCVANFFGQVLPGGIGSDAVRVWKTHRGGMPLRIALTSVALDRLVALLGLLLLVAMMQPALQTRLPEHLAWLFPLLAAAGIACTVGLGLLDHFPLASSRFAVVRAAHALAADTRSVFFRPGHAAKVVVVTLLSHVNLALVVWVLACGLGVNVPVADTIVLFSQVLVVSMLPLSIAGWGVREATMVILFGHAGVSAEHSLTVSTLFGIGTVLTALPGGLIRLISKERVPPIKELAGSPTLQFLLKRAGSGGHHAELGTAGGHIAGELKKLRHNPDFRLHRSDRGLDQHRIGLIHRDFLQRDAVMRDADPVVLAVMRHVDPKQQCDGRFLLRTRAADRRARSLRDQNANLYLGVHDRPLVARKRLVQLVLVCSLHVRQQVESAFEQPVDLRRVADHDSGATSPRVAQRP